MVAQEVRAILKARKLGVLTPAVYFAEPEASTIYMEKLDAKMLKELLVPGSLSSEGKPLLAYAGPKGMRKGLE